LRLNGHQDAVTHIEFGADGKTLASASRDTTVLLWDLSGQGRPRTAAIPEKEFETLWQDLLGGDAAKSYRAMHRMASVPEQTVPYLRERSAPVDVKRQQRLIADLDSDQFERRDTAARELDKVLEQAEPALRKASQDHPWVEVRRRVERLLEPLPVRAVRLAELLELAGTPEARRRMEKWAEGLPELKLTQEAQATLKRWAR
jgi:WD domain, G-beta repeat